MTAADERPLDLAQRLLAAGIPVVVVEPDRYPTGWQTVTAAECDLSSFRPGHNALAAVGGHGLDWVDVDSKDGKGGSVDNLPAFKSYGTTRTPSGGEHYVVPSCGIGKIEGLTTPLGFVGDYVGGRPDGSGRLLAFLPGSTRQKYPNGGYVEEVPWDVGGCLAARPDPDLMAALLKAGGGRERHADYVDDSPKRPAADGVHPYAAKGIANELARLDKCSLLGWGGPPWDSTVHAVGCQLIRFGNSGWTGYSLEVAEADLLARAPDDTGSCAPGDKGFGPREHAAKWMSALDTVGNAGRRNPDDTAAEVFALEDLFDSTPILRHIRQAAHARMVGAPALLLYVLARVLAEVPPGVALPPTIGGKASLNFAVSVVGGSGDGKSVLVVTSRELLGLVGVTQLDIERVIGSGEGLVQQFLVLVGKPQKLVLTPDPRRIMLVDEIDQLGATKHRNGATISPILRSALTGGPLGQANAAADRNRHLPAGVYRLILLLGVQPTRSDTLLEDADAGLPQRLVWVRALDAIVPEEDVEWPGPLTWEMPDNLPALIDYPDHIRREIRATRRRQGKPGSDPLDGHRLLTRLKVATAMALLHGDVAITDQWWEMAGRIIDTSMAVQKDCQRVLAAAGADRSRNTGRLAGIQEEGTAEYRNERVEAAARAIWRTVRKHANGAKDGSEQKHDPGEGCTSRCISRALRHYVDRDTLRRGALERAAEDSWIEERGERWTIGDSQPA